MKKKIQLLVILLTLVIISCYDNPTEPIQEEDDLYNLQIEFVDDDVVELSWESNTNNNSYIISRNIGEFGWIDDYREISSGTTSLLDTIPTQSVILYSYYLNEISEDAIVGVSDTVAWFSDDVFPDEFNVEQIKQDSIKLSWQDSSMGEFAYRIDRKIGNDVWDENHVIFEPDFINGYGSFINCVDYIETVEDTIFYRICIVNGKSKSNYNETSIFSTILPPENLVGSIEENNIRLNWIENCQIETGFIIERKCHGEEFQVIDTIGENITNWLDNNFEPSLIYYYRIKMLSGEFSSGYSNTIVGNIEHEGYWVPFEYLTIQEAINALDVSGEIMITPGVYNENIQINNKYPIIKSFYSLFGEEQYIEQTIIDGEQNGSVIAFADCNSDTPSINGLTLQNGSGNLADITGSGWFYFCGGGILLENSNLNISNLVIMNNRTQLGAGITCLQNSNCLVENTIINDNTTISSLNYNGGGIFCDDSEMTIDNSSICDNSANSDGGGILIATSIVNISNSIINSNISGGYGGGISMNIGSEVSLENLSINNNSAHGGGGLYSSHTSPVMRNLIISGNCADTGGGGIRFISTQEPVFENILLVNNIADYGAGIYLGSVDLNVTNVTAYGNVATLGGGALFGIHYANPVIMNSIFWNNSPQEIMIRPSNMPSGEGSVTVLYSDIDGGIESISALDPNDIYWLEGNLVTDPLFLNPGNDDFHLPTGSPCIDAGNPSREYRDTDGTRNDMGTYGGPNANL